MISEWLFSQTTSETNSRIRTHLWRDRRWSCEPTVPASSDQWKGTSFICILNIKMMTLGFHLVCCVTWRAARYRVSFLTFPPVGDVSFQSWDHHTLRPWLASIAAVGYSLGRRKRGGVYFCSVRSIPIIISDITDAVLAVYLIFLYLSLHQNRIWISTRISYGSVQLRSFFLLLRNKTRAMQYRSTNALIYLFFLAKFLSLLNMLLK